MVVGGGFGAVWFVAVWHDYGWDCIVRCGMVSCGIMLLLMGLCCGI